MIREFAPHRSAAGLRAYVMETETAAYRCRTREGHFDDRRNSAFPSLGFPANVGSRLLRDIKFKFDATLVKRFDAAALIPFARTNVSEYGVVRANAALGGLHHEYFFAPTVAPLSICG
jgi:hypothetical protein